MCKIIRVYPLFVLVIFLVLKLNSATYPQRGIYSRITHEDQFIGFSGLINYNRDARMDLLEKELTIFIPTNAAFENYPKALHSDLAFYHMAVGARTLNDLKSVKNVSSIRGNFPKIWVTPTNDGIFVNNARIIRSKSDYSGRSSNNGKDQVLHIIDDVLDPVIRNPSFPHTAYDFMVAIEQWQLDPNKYVANFFYKIKEQKVAHLYQLEGSNTYFVPVDYGIDSYKFKMLNKNIIFAHIIPGHVLFTRPTMKGLYYRTMSNDGDISMELAVEEIDGKFYVKGNTVIGSDQNPEREFTTEIIQSNIPVFNGVVHLIDKPIGIFDRHLKPFPYVSIMEKLAVDANLATVYEMGENTGLNKLFATHNVSFTYFVPNDFAWRQIKKKRLSFSGSDVDLLKRHLIISDFPYSMENLLALSSGRNYTNVELKTVGGYLRLLVLQIGGNFFIRWDKTFIKVIRPNYECTDGLIHVLAGPIANLS